MKFFFLKNKWRMCYLRLPNDEHIFSQLSQNYLFTSSCDISLTLILLLYISQIIGEFIFEQKWKIFKKEKLTRFALIWFPLWICNMTSWISAHNLVNAKLCYKFWKLIFISTKMLIILYSWQKSPYTTTIPRWMISI